jgi:succinate-semialdehyde dehydrogenase / glutarate-semialdehyde dehydrogenase
MAAMKMGPGTEPATQLGPLVNAASRDKVAAPVDDAVKRGAVVLMGGLTPQVSGYFYPPTVIADVPEGSRLLDEEIFGPVAPMITFDSEQEGICLANRTEFGLVAYVYTKDLARGLRGYRPAKIGRDVATPRVVKSRFEAGRRQ